jgi:inorganic triphosphatase YgiF
MSRPEIELKLTLAASDVSKVEASPALEPGRRSRRSRTLVSTYFDTPDDRLSRQGLHLRVRETGGSWVQTVKSTRAGLARGEWERAIPSPSPVAEMGDGSPADSLLAKRKLRDALAPAFRVDVQRTTWDLKLPRADVEVALDRGTITAGDKRHEVCEVELELKSGDGDTLFDLARALRGSAPVRLSLLSKGRQGYRLRAGQEDEPEKPALPPMRLGDPPSSGARALLTACMASLLLNLSLVAQSPRVELVHQARVALRRVRAALDLFGPVLGKAEAEGLLARLGELSDHLGAARDLDVFLETGCERIAESVRTTVRAHVEARRERAYAGLAAELASDAHFLLMLSLLKIAETGGDPDGDESLRGYLARALDRRFRKLAKASRGLDSLGEHDRHRVRIRAKKLRYMIEFFEDVAPAGPFRRMRDTLEALQEALGELNDAVVARSFAEDALAAAGVPDPASQVAALPHARRRDREHMDEARRARRRLARLKPFWAGWRD